MNEKFFTLSPEKQARITNAALEVFARNDYKHASTDDIAAKASLRGFCFTISATSSRCTCICTTMRWSRCAGRCCGRSWTA